MATPRELSSYPSRYFDIINRAGKGKEIVLSFNSAAEARAFRSRMYAFRNALYRDALQAPGPALLAPVVRFRIDGQDLIVTSEEAEYGIATTVS